MLPPYPTKACEKGEDAQRPAGAPEERGLLRKGSRPSLPRTRYGGRAAETQMSRLTLSVTSCSGVRRPASGVRRAVWGPRCQCQVAFSSLLLLSTLDGLRVVSGRLPSTSEPRRPWGDCRSHGGGRAFDGAPFDTPPFDKLRTGSAAATPG